MARPKSIEARINALTEDQQLRLHGIVGLVDKHTTYTPVSASLSETHAHGFFCWLAKEQPANFQQLLRAYALEVVSS